MHKQLDCAVLLEVFQCVMETEIGQQALSGLPIESFLNKLKGLDKGSFEAFSSLSYSQFFLLLQVLAHPNFFEFISKLPPEACYQEMMHWIAHPTDAPECAEEALSELLAYQNNPERVAEGARIRLQALQQQYKMDLNRLQRILLPKPVVQAPVIAPLEVQAPEKSAAADVGFIAAMSWFELGLRLTMLTLITAYCAIYFSLVLLASTAIIGALLLKPIIEPLVQKAMAVPALPVPPVEEPTSAISLPEPIKLQRISAPGHYAWFMRAKPPHDLANVPQELLEVESPSLL